MGMGDIVVMTDHGSNEGSRPLLEAAVEILTGTRPLRNIRTGSPGSYAGLSRALRRVAVVDPAAWRVPTVWACLSSSCPIVR
jgi:hypothetical protein